MWKTDARKAFSENGSSWSSSKLLSIISFSEKHVLGVPVCRPHNFVLKSNYALINYSLF